MMMAGLIRFNLAILIGMLLLHGCREASFPRPRGHFRIELPEKEYVSLNASDDIPALPFDFEYPVYGLVNFNIEESDEPGWFNLEFPSYKAVLYMTYKPVKNDFAGIMEQTYRMNVKNHTHKADAINEQAFRNDDEKVYGILYDLKGNTATAVQFYATDSTSHYLRGSLYFEAEPDADSLAPVINFFREDIIHLMETLKWNKTR